MHAWARGATSSAWSEKRVDEGSHPMGEWAVFTRARQPGDARSAPGSLSEADFDELRGEISGHLDAMGRRAKEAQGWGMTSAGSMTSSSQLSDQASSKGMNYGEGF